MSTVKSNQSFGWTRAHGTVKCLLANSTMQYHNINQESNANYKSPKITSSNKKSKNNITSVLGRYIIEYTV
jgi:hypothetical protein